MLKRASNETCTCVRRLYKKPALMRYAYLPMPHGCGALAPVSDTAVAEQEATPPTKGTPMYDVFDLHDVNLGREQNVETLAKAILFGVAYGAHVPITGTPAQLESLLYALGRRLGAVPFKSEITLSLSMPGPIPQKQTKFGAEYKHDTPPKDKL